MQEKIQYINVEDIIPNRFQPRKNFDQDSLQELAESIKQHGLIQPLVLRKLGNKFEIIAGERRYKAANMIGLKQVPSIVMELDDATSAEIALAENIQRKDLTAVEKAKSYKQILSLGQMTQEELAKKMGKSQPAVSNTLRLLDLSDDVQQALLKNKISERHARSLLSLKNHDSQVEMLNHIIENRMTVRETDLAIKDFLEQEKNNPPVENEKEEVEEIIDFGSDNSQNIENTNNNNLKSEEAITEEEPNNEIQNTVDNEIPDFDQININHGNKFINNYANLDDEAANMDIGNNEENDDKFDNFVSIPTDEPILNSTKEEKEVSPTPMLSEENNIYNQQIPENATQGNVYNPQPQDPNMMYNQTQPQNYGQNIPYYPGQQMPMQDPNMMYNQMQPQNYGQNAPYYPGQQMPMQDPNMMYNQMQAQTYGQNVPYYPGQQMPMQAQNYGQTPYGNDMNNAQGILPQQDGGYAAPQEEQPVQEQETGPQAMIMQHDITGAVAIIRNTVMNLQNNGYMVQMDENDETNKYTITITLDK